MKYNYTIILTFIIVVTALNKNTKNQKKKILEKYSHDSIEAVLFMYFIYTTE